MQILNFKSLEDGSHRVRTLLNNYRLHNTTETTGQIWIYPQSTAILHKHTVTYRADLSRFSTSNIQRMVRIITDCTLLVKNSTTIVTTCYKYLITGRMCLLCTLEYNYSILGELHKAVGGMIHLEITQRTFGCGLYTQKQGSRFHRHDYNIDCCSMAVYSLVYACMEKSSGLHVCLIYEINFPFTIVYDELSDGVT